MRVIDQYFRFHPSEILKKDKKHLKLLKRHGLNYFKYYVLPAAGPKAFVSSGFEYQLKSLHAKGKITGKKWFIGGSTGALRACAFLSGLLTGKDLTKEIKDTYCKMHYDESKGSDDLGKMMLEMFETCLPVNCVNDVLNHPQFKIAIIVTELAPMASYLPPIALKSLFAGVIVANAVFEAAAPAVCNTICFYTGDSPPACLLKDNSLSFTRLVPENVYQVLHATTAIPFVSKPCHYIHGRGTGLFYDGGMTNYYLNFELQNPAILLGDLHPEEPIYRTGFDAFIPSILQRSLPARYLNHCSVVRPTHVYMQQFPDGKLPSVSDWFNKQYIDKPHLRHEFWNNAFNLSRKFWGI
jgi:hypothetical protein